MTAPAPWIQYKVRAGCSRDLLLITTSGYADGEPEEAVLDRIRGSGGSVVDLAALTDLANRTDTVALSQDQRDDAALFHFILHYVMQWPFPYDKPSGLAAMPPHQLIQSGNIRRYLGTIDAMALTEQEWRRDMPDYLKVPGTSHVAQPR